MANLRNVAENTNQRAVQFVGDEDEDYRHTVVNAEFPYEFPVVLSKEYDYRTVQEV